MGLSTISVSPDPTLNVPPPGLSVTPLLALLSARLARGWKMPLSKTNWAALKPAGLPPRLVWEYACSVVPKDVTMGPVKFAALPA